MPHLNYDLLLWGVNFKDIFLLQKKAIRLVTHNIYNSHTEPILKENGLLNLIDMFLLNKLKFLHNLFHNNLPSYFQTYCEHFTNLVVNYNLTLSDPGYFRQLTIWGVGFKSPPPLRSRKLICQSSPYHTCEFDQVF